MKYQTGNKELDERISMAGMSVKTVSFDQEGNAISVTFHGHHTRLSKAGSTWEIFEESQDHVAILNDRSVHERVEWHLEKAKKAEAERDDQRLKAWTLKGMQVLRESLRPEEP